MSSRLDEHHHHHDGFQWRPFQHRSPPPHTPPHQPRLDGLTTAMASTSLQSPPRGGEGRREKPLPALPPARTPSQISHQRQMQMPYRPPAHMRYASAPAVPAVVAGPSRLPATMETRQEESRLPVAQPPRPPAPSAPSIPSVSQAVPSTAPPAYDDIFRTPPPVPPHLLSSSSALASLPRAPPPTAAATTSNHASPARPPQPSPRAPTTPDTRPPLWRPPSAPQSSSSLSSSTAGPSTSSNRPRIASPLAATAGAPSSTPQRRVVSSYEPRRPTPSAQAGPSRITPAPTAHTATPSPHQRRVRFPSSSPSSSSSASPRTPAARPRLSTTASPSPSSSRATSSTGARGQCWGIKRDGQRCTRIVRLEEDELGGRGGSPAARRGGPQQQRSKRHTSAPPALAQRQAQARARPNGQALGPASRSQPIYISSDEEDDDDGGRSKRPSGRSDSDDEDSPQATDPVYCHQHAREINKTPGLHVPVAQSSSSSNTTPQQQQQQRYLSFDRYIPTTLSPLTAAKLRVAMSEPFAIADIAERGHIYVYELVSDEEDGGAGGSRGEGRSLFKVGRSTRPMARVAQWRKQCESRKAVLRYLSPCSSSNPAGPPTAARATPGLLIGASPAPSLGQRGSHRWEKLVHLELAEVAPRPACHGIAGGRCRDCGKRHREIFGVRQGGGGRNEVEVVKEVVERWRRFVEVAVPCEAP